MHDPPTLCLLLYNRYFYNCNLEAPDKYLGATWKTQTGCNSPPAFLCGKEGLGGHPESRTSAAGHCAWPEDHLGRKLPQQSLLELHPGSLAWNLLLGLAAECSPQPLRTGMWSLVAPVTSSNCLFQTWK